VPPVAAMLLAVAVMMIGSVVVPSVLMFHVRRYRTRYIVSQDISRL
jgi:hypothetical protein